jgi:hypothetical protein
MEAQFERRASSEKSADRPRARSRMTDNGRHCPARLRRSAPAAVA